MEDFIKQMAERVGISEDQATQLMVFLREHASEMPQMLGNSDMIDGIGDKLEGFMGGD